MNKISIHALIRSTAAMLAALSAMSCSEEYAAGIGSDDGRIEVRIAAPTTRTSIADDGMTGIWTKGDKIALWAFEGQSAIFAAETFSLWHTKPDLSDACFSARIAPMAAGRYDYYAVSPAPAAVAGSTVTYEIPSTQDGSWNGALDIMHATTQGAELTEGLNELVLDFRHKVHALRITVPEGRNRFGSAVERLVIAIPQEEAPHLTIDPATPDAATTL
ncbi:MAG: fimbrillin family protein, partial [Alistipes sp.]|nr:fimbrillin family protein [Alistipes sp.]